MTAAPFRLPVGGAIDRTRSLAFTFDGRTYTGHPGDTLASALLANGVRVLGRSFKYHRPRGIFTAGPEEPNALARVGASARAEPNPRGPHREYWHHANGCRAYVVVERDTATHAVVSSDGGAA